MFESLEKRQLLSAVLSSNEPGLLIIFGTTGADEIRIDRTSNGRISVDQKKVVYHDGQRTLEPVLF
jgi:hypothetical protein